MFQLILSTVLLYPVARVFIRIFRRVFAKTPLDNIPGPPSPSFFKGVFPDVFSIDGWKFNKDISEKYGGLVKITGMLGENQLYISDPKALRYMFLKEQDLFEETPQFIITNYLIFGPGLLGTLGEVHHKQKKMLNPSFSNASLRNMLPTFYDITFKFRDTVRNSLDGAPKEVDMLAWMNRVALELIGQCGLGYSFDSLTDEHTPHPYSKSSKRLPSSITKNYLAREYLLPMAIKIGTPTLRRFLLDLIPKKSLHELRDIADVLHNTSVEILESKKSAFSEGDAVVQDQIGHGKDILSTLMEANISASAQDSLSEAELLGQITSLTFAATDTTATLLARILDLLAHNPEMQNRLRKELSEAHGHIVGGMLSYEDLMALPLLDAIYRETLRLYPPIPLLTRITTADVHLPLSNSITGLDGQRITEAFIPKHTTLIVSILAANRNPALWGQDSYEWKPERWLKPLPEAVLAERLPGVFSHVMSFLGGNRACIGFKFSQLETKVVLSTLVETFHFYPSDKEVFWQFSAIVAPVVVNNEAPQLPLMVRLVERTECNG